MAIALTAPTGKVGTAFLRAAAARGAAVRALLRDPGKLAGTAGVAETARFDLADPATFVPALTGAEVLVLVTAAGPQHAEREIAVIDAARTAGVGHVVKLSAQGAPEGGRFTRQHGEVERHLAGAPIGSTILRPTFFMQNALGLAAPIAGGTFPAAMGSARMGQIDTRDIGEVALAAATSPAAHAGRTYTLTGPAAYTGDEIAAELAAALGHDVRYVGLSETAFADGLRAAGVDDWYAGGLLELYQAVRAGQTAELSADVHAILGRAPRDFAAFARDVAPAFQVPAQT